MTVMQARITNIEARKPKPLQIIEDPITGEKNIIQGHNAAIRLELLSYGSCDDFFNAIVKPGWERVLVEVRILDGSKTEGAAE